MSDRERLDGAVEAGIVSRETADALTAYFANQRSGARTSEERFRLASGFNDFFVSVAAIILLVAIWAIGDAMMSDWHLYREKVNDHGRYKGLGPVCTAVMAWLLAEYFTQIRKLTLPSIVLFAAFFIGLGYGLAYFYFDYDYANHGKASGWTCASTFYDDSPWDKKLLLEECAKYKLQVQREHPAFAAIALLLAGFSCLHWRRFKLSISVAAVIAALSAMVLYSMAWLFRFESMNSAAPLLIILGAGIATFGYAMWWDMSDRNRETQRSDIAFWLHLLAAPMISHSVFMLIGVSDGDEIGEWAVAAVLAIYLFFAFVALAIDRRALLVSALAYVLIALTALFRTFGMVELNVALTALIIGSALLTLSAFWITARQAIVTRLPERIRERLPAT